MRLLAELTPSAAGGHETPYDVAPETPDRSWGVLVSWQMNFRVPGASLLFRKYEELASYEVEMCAGAEVELDTCSTQSPRDH